MDDFTITLNIKSKLDYLPLIRRVVREICSSLVCKEEIFQDIELCLNEALSNVIHHAYHNESDRELQLMVTLCKDEVVFQIVDQGLKNPYLNKPLMPDQDLIPLNPLEETGRGLFIIHKLMDEVIYSHKENKNILFLRKRFK